MACYLLKTIIFLSLLDSLIEYVHIPWYIDFNLQWLDTCAVFDGGEALPVDSRVRRQLSHQDRSTRGRLVVCVYILITYLMSNILIIIYML